MVCYQTCISVFAIVTGECTVLLLQKYGFKVYSVSFCFRSFYFDSLYPFLFNKHTEIENNYIFFLIAIVKGEFTMLKVRKYCFKVWVISFYFYSTHYKVYTHRPCINTHQRTTAPFDINYVISSSDCQTPRLVKLNVEFVLCMLFGRLGWTST